MSMFDKFLDKGLVPDSVTRVGIRHLLYERLTDCEKGSLEKNYESKMAYVEKLKTMPIAVNTADANVQHYEVPTEFYLVSLGKRLKYSSCLYPPGVNTLDEAEEAMFNLYCERAQLKDGMDILDLGCGWGSLSLFLAEKYPNSKITGLSNSSTQKLHIMGTAEKKGFKNLQIHTADINQAELNQKFDRILSIEMFEHMKNYKLLFKKVSSWMKDDAYLFIHIFTHKNYAYDFEQDDGWMATYFFTGGTMPSADLFHYFQDDVTLNQQWWVNGKHYGRTCEDWLKKTDQNRSTILKIFGNTYGESNAYMWYCRWRIFYMSCAELFNYNDGEEWGVSHYLFKKKI